MKKSELIKKLMENGCTQKEDGKMILSDSIFEKLSQDGKIIDNYIKIGNSKIFFEREEKKGKENKKGEKAPCHSKKLESKKFSDKSYIKLIHFQREDKEWWEIWGHHMDGEKMKKFWIGKKMRYDSLKEAKSEYERMIQAYDRQKNHDMRKLREA
jgi:hypothetical protein